MVFEAGLFGGALGMRRTFILHAKGAKLPTDLLGMTAVRYPEALTAADMRAVNQKLRKAIEDEGRLTRLEGDWWQHSLTLRTEREPSAISLLRISRDREGGLEVAGRGWQEDGTLSVSVLERGLEGAPRPAQRLLLLEGRATAAAQRPAARGHGRDPPGGSPIGPPGYWTTRSEADPQLRERTSGVYLRADPDDMRILDGGDATSRAGLLAVRLLEWKAISNS